MQFNPMQELAAYGDFDKNVLVSAGAGSGKTQVLTTRVTQLIEGLNKPSIKPTELLVLTFTNDAAAEMKSRVRQKIVEKELDEYLPFVEQSYITTFDSFNLAICRKYFYALNISPDLTICDSNVLMAKKMEILAEIISSYYEKKDEVFFDYLDKFTDKKDNSLYENLKSIITSIDLKGNSLKFLEEYNDNFFCEKYYEMVKKELHSLAHKKVNELYEMLEGLLEVAGDSRTIDGINSLLASIKGASSYEDFYRIYSIDIPSKKKEDDLIYSDLRKSIIEVRKKNSLIFKNETLDDFIKDYKNTKSNVNLYIDILKEYYKRMNQYQHENSVYDFIDVQKLAIKLVEENEEIRKEIKYSFKEILIDEYQDTSDLQELFISYIENDNLFMVGDIKQSIYRFRNANPAIFKGKYETYSPITKDIYPSQRNNMKEYPGYLIDMNQNFRSRSEVLFDINLMFNKLMTSDVGDANYKESHNMIYGLTSYDNGVCSEEKGFRSDFIFYPFDKTLGLKKPEIEAYIIANDIKSKVGTYKVMSKNGEFYNATYDDFCILCDRQASFDTLREILEENNIPVVINADESISESYNSQVIINLIKLVSYEHIFMLDYKKKKVYEKSYYHALASVLRSFICEASDNEIFEIVAKRDNLNPVSKLARNIALDIDKMSSAVIYKDILNSFGYYEKITIMGSVAKFLKEAEFIHDKIRDLSKLGYNFTEIADILSAMLDDENTGKYKIDSSNQHGVRIMNIHKSKGLEFKVCYFADMDHNYNEQNKKATIGFDKKYGIYLPFYNEGEDNTCIKDLSNAAWEKETVSERLRLFYVALTRAREKMIFILPYLKEKPVATYKHKKFSDYFDYLYDKEPSLFKNVTSLDEEAVESFLTMKNNFVSKHIPSHKETIYVDLKIENEFISKSHISKRMKKIIDDKTRVNIENGLRYHEALEMLDFKSQVKSLESMKLDLSTKGVIEKVLDCDIMNNLHSAKALKEHEFSCVIDNESYHGIIDLLAIYDDHIDIIDYKLKNFDDDAYDRQLSIYKSYVETKTDKPVNCYLLSIIDATYRKVDL